MAIKEKVGKAAGKIKKLLHSNGPQAMDTAVNVGETAGKVWQLLHDGGPQTLTEVEKALKEPVEVVLFAVGWLAREEKILITVEERSFRLSLR
jgi:hypothetical protein